MPFRVIGGYFLTAAQATALYPTVRGSSILPVGGEDHVGDVLDDPDTLRRLAEAVTIAHDRDNVKLTRADVLKAEGAAASRQFGAVVSVRAALWKGPATTF